MQSSAEPRPDPDGRRARPVGRPDGDGAPPTDDGSDPLAWALRRVADRWSLHIVDALLRGPRRFGELAREVAGVAPNILTSRLRTLEADGIVRAARYQERPARFEYALTDAGQELAGALAVLRSWGARQGGDGQHLARHAACGTELELRPFCPTCERAVEDGEELIWM
ncbi:MAG: helix-turn-helix domain-containing protein [Acidimicrobiales bacterium]